MRFKLISCEVLYREMCATVARSPHQVDVEFLPKGLHDCGSEEMLAKIQQMVDGVSPAAYDGVLMGYGLCGNGLAGLRARFTPVVLPRAHDCITLFLGSKERYGQYFQEHPGVYFKTTGWMERGEDISQLPKISLRKQGYGLSYEEMVAKYGEDNARYLESELHNYNLKYTQFTFIKMGVEPDDRFERRALEQARERGWKYEEVEGDMSLIEALVNGDWDESKFLVVKPGWRVVARYDDGIVASEPGEE